MNSAQELLNEFRGIYRGSTRKHKRNIATIAAMIYHIWDTRNKNIFEDANPDADKVMRKIQIDIHKTHPAV